MQRVLDAEGRELQQEAVRQVERADPGGSNERTSASAASTSAVVLVVSLRGSPRVVTLQVSVLVDVADEVSRRSPALRPGASAMRELPVQVLGQTLGARQDVLERELLGLLLVLPRVVRRVEVVLEVGVEVDLLERVPLLLRRRRGRVGRGGGGASSLSSRLASARSVSVSSCSSRIGFSTTSWLRTSWSSRRDICSSLIACCSDGVMTSRWESRRLSFCSSAMAR